MSRSLFPRCPYCNFRKDKLQSHMEKCGARRENFRKYNPRKRKPRL